MIVKIFFTYVFYDKIMRNTQNHIDQKKRQRGI